MTRSYDPDPLANMPPEWHIELLRWIQTNRREVFEVALYGLMLEKGPPPRQGKGTHGN